MKPWALLLAGLLAYVGLPAQAAFEIGANPSRFELSGRNGARVGQTLELHNLSTEDTELAVRTLDWVYSEEGQLSFHEELLPGSCRPWVLLERQRLLLPARSQYAYRFQIDVPDDAPRGECRFMIAVEGLEPADQASIEGAGGASLSLPVSGRIAIAVYARINGAAPKLELMRVGMREVHGERQPFVEVSNDGDAHGRLGGALDATDAEGRPFLLQVAGSPIMPGQTHVLELQSRLVGGDAQARPSYPLKVQGLLDWEHGGFRINTELQ